MIIFHEISNIFSDNLFYFFFLVILIICPLEKKLPTAKEKSEK